ncbi:MAG: type 1 glutamine amidotransferase domain-containing protein [Deferribacterota bacterium]|nr:type 1 glutamine amidotransferase domain-containing protein [Deferribacterota bacterium]
MKKIAVVVADYFEDSEYTEPVKAFKEKGYEVINISFEAGKSVKGKNGKASVVPEKSIDEVSVNDFDALLIPGGFSPDILRADDRFVNFVKNFAESKKPIFAICHGPQLLITADVIKGVRMTGYKSIIQDIKNAGAIFEDKSVVVDKNFVTSRTPKDLDDFIRESLNMLK